MHPELGPWHISSYWLITCLSLIPVLLFTYRTGVYVEHVPRKIMLWMVAVILAAQFFGGGIISYFYDWHRIGIYLGPYQFWTTGRFFHSALFSTLAAFVLFLLILRKYFSRPLCWYLDYFAVGACMMSAIDRIGCFLQGCCFGKPTDSFLGVRFPQLPGPVHPTQLYHFAFEGFVLLPLLFLMQKKKRFAGETFWCYLCVYSVFRFFIEFLRTNPVVWLGLTHAQIFSLLAAFVSGLFWRQRRAKARTYL